MALVLSGSIDISGSMTATTILISSPGAAGMVSSSAQIGELVPLMQSTSSINNLTGSLITTSSNNVIAIDGLNTYTASIKGAIEVSGQNVNVLGMITAQQFNVTYVSSSVMYQSGSNKFGNSFDDKHEVTGSLNVSGGLLVNGTSAVTITSNTAGNNTLNLVSTNSANSGKLQFGGATYGATIEKNSLGADNGLVFNSYHGGAEGYTFQSNGATKLKIGSGGKTEITGSLAINSGNLNVDGGNININGTYTRAKTMTGTANGTDTIFSISYGFPGAITGTVKVFAAAGIIAGGNLSTCVLTFNFAGANNAGAGAQASNVSNSVLGTTASADGSYTTISSLTPSITSATTSGFNISLANTITGTQTTAPTYYIEVSYGLHGNASIS